MDVFRNNQPTDVDVKQPALEPTVSSLRPSSPRRGFSLVELLLVIAIIAVIISLLLPAVHEAREAVRRTHCLNNLRQLSLALHTYAQSYSVLPPGVVNASGPIRNQAEGYHMSWIVQILPMLDQANLYRALDFRHGVYDQPSRSVWGQPNRSVCETHLPVVSCPSNRIPPIAELAGQSHHSSYAGCHHDREAAIDITNVGAFTLNSSTRFDAVPDGTSNTIFLGEVRLPSAEDLANVPDLDPGPAGLLGWASGTRATLRNTSGINSGPAIPPPDAIAADFTGPVGGFGSHHPHGAHFALGDGSVRFIYEAIDRLVLQNLGNPADGNMPGKF